MAMSAVSNFLNNLKQFCRVVFIVQSSCCTGGQVSDADAKLAEENATANTPDTVPAEQQALERNLLAQHMQHRMLEDSHGATDEHRHNRHQQSGRTGPLAIPVRWDPAAIQPHGEYHYGSLPGAESPPFARVARPALTAGHGRRDVEPVCTHGSPGDDPEPPARPKRYRPRQRLRTLTGGTTDSVASSLRTATARDEHRYAWLARFFSQQPSPPTTK